MPFAFPNVSVSPPLRYQRLTVFPLQLTAPSSVDYALGDEGIAGGWVKVTEVNHAGSVPDLLVDNQGSQRVLFLEGEQLIGAKQNRVLNTSLLVASGGKVKIPVSCVEQGRWAYESAEFRSSGSHSPSNVRAALKASVAKSLEQGLGHRSDQLEVWNEVARQQHELGVVSGTGAMYDTFEQNQGRIQEYEAHIPYSDGACGLAVGIGERLICIDLVDKAATCQKLWQRLIAGFVLDSLSAQANDRQLGIEQVQQFLTQLHSANWKAVSSIGEGEEYRCEINDQVQASALTLDDSLVHASLVVAV